MSLGMASVDFAATAAKLAMQSRRTMQSISDDAETAQIVADNVYLLQVNI
jgi:hypothetical protein